MTTNLNKSQADKSKVKVHKFDIFKGMASKDGKVEKISSVGHSTLFEGSTTYSVYLKTLLNDTFFLLPEQSVERPFDYVILTREPSNMPGKKYFWNRVGTAKLLSDQNAGIMKLDFDLFSGVDLYFSFHGATVREFDATANPAA